MPPQCDLAGGGSIVRCGNAAERALTIGTDDLGLDAAPVWRLTNRWQNRTDSVSETGFGFRICIVQSCLDHVICERVAKHFLELVRIEHLFDHNTRNIGISAPKALLDDVGAEFLFRK